MSSEYDKVAQEILTRYVLKIEKAKKRKVDDRVFWEDMSCGYITAIRQHLNKSGLSPKMAFYLARDEEAPTRSGNLYKYLQYCLSLTFINAVELSAIIVSSSNPWEVEDFLEKLAILSADAYCFADELNQINDKDFWYF